MSSCILKIYFFENLKSFCQTEQFTERTIQTASPHSRLILFQLLLFGSSVLSSTFNPHNYVSRIQVHEVKARNLAKEKNQNLYTEVNRFSPHKEEALLKKKYKKKILWRIFPLMQSVKCLPRKTLSARAYNFKATFFVCGQLSTPSHSSTLSLYSLFFFLFRFHDSIIVTTHSSIFGLTK